MPQPLFVNAMRNSPNHLALWAGWKTSLNGWLPGRDNHRHVSNGRLPRSSLATTGVVAQGVAAFPQDVTKQMVANFQSGGAAVNQICKTFDIGLKVFELALEIPTRDITVAAALDEDECAATIAYGMEAIAGGCDLLCIGEMGIGNTTIAAALAYALHGGAASDWAGPGNGAR